MISLKELMVHLEEMAPLSLQESYDNSGLLFGSPEWRVKGVVCCLDATEEVIREAHGIGCNVVVSHHPIVFKGIKKIRPHHYVDKALIYAIKNDIALYAIHTNLDNVLNNGVSRHVADRMRLQGCRILDPKCEGIDTGTGIIGRLESAMEPLHFLKWLKELMQTPCIRHTALLNRPIQTVAVTGGAGASWISKAREEGVDAYVTGDVKYHEFFEANQEIMVCDIGHYESEQFTIELLAGLISSKFSNFAAHCTKLNTNPVQYF